MRWARLQRGVQRAEPWVVAVALACTGWTLLATPVTQCRNPDVPEQRATFVARGDCGTGLVKLEKPAGSCDVYFMLTAPEHLRLPNGPVAAPQGPNQGWDMRGRAVVPGDDAGMVTHAITVSCQVRRRGGDILDGGTEVPFADGGDPDQLLCDCVNEGAPVGDGGVDGGADGSSGLVDTAAFACDYTLDPT